MNVHEARECFEAAAGAVLLRECFENDHRLADGPSSDDGSRTSAGTSDDGAWSISASTIRQFNQDLADEIHRREAVSPADDEGPVAFVRFATPVASPISMAPPVAPPVPLSKGFEAPVAKPAESAFIIILPQLPRPYPNDGKASPHACTHYEFIVAVGPFTFIQAMKYYRDRVDNRLATIDAKITMEVIHRQALPLL